MVNFFLFVFVSDRSSVCHSVSDLKALLALRALSFEGQSESKILRLVVFNISLISFQGSKAVQTLGIREAQ